LISTIGDFRSGPASRSGNVSAVRNPCRPSCRRACINPSAATGAFRCSGGGIVVVVLALVACGLGTVSIVPGYVKGERRNCLNGLEQTLNEIQVSETSLRNGVATAQSIWREAGSAPAPVVDDARPVRPITGARWP